MTRAGYGYGSSRAWVRAVNLPPMQNPHPQARVGGQGMGFFFVLLSSSTANTLKPITVSLSEATIALAPPATSGPCMLCHSFVSSVTCCGLPSSSSMARTPSMPYDSNLRPLSLLAVMSLCQADSSCLNFGTSPSSNSVDVEGPCRPSRQTRATRRSTFGTFVDSQVSESSDASLCATSPVLSWCCAPTYASPILPPSVSVPIGLLYHIYRTNFGRCRDLDA
jgi:hypothetical protein